MDPLNAAQADALLKAMAEFLAVASVLANADDEAAFSEFHLTPGMSREDLIKDCREVAKKALELLGKA